MARCKVEKFKIVYKKCGQKPPKLKIIMYLCGAIYENVPTLHLGQTGFDSGTRWYVSTQ